MNEAPVLHAIRLHVQDLRGAIYGLTLALPAGPIGALIGTPSDGTSALTSALAGLLRPLGGALTVAGRAPHADPALRARIGALLDEPMLPDVGRVRDLLVMARRLRGGEAPRESWYEPLGLALLEMRSIASLDRSERRNVGLALALAVPSPILIALHEPLAEVSHASADTLGPLLRARSEAGACVLLLTASVRDATTLADDVAMLERGAIGRAVGAPDIDALTPGSPVELHVWCDMQRAMASALVLDPLVQGVTWSASEANAAITVLGADLESCARAVARVASANGVNVRALRPVIPSTPEVNAATAGMVLAARHHAAYGASRPPVEPGNPS